MLVLPVRGMDRDGTESKTIQSVENAFRILNELLRREQATVTELSDVVGLSKGTVHHYLATLRNENVVEQVDGKYQLGLRSLSFGGAARERETVFQIGKDGVDRLAETTGETARLVVERDGYGITLHQATSADRNEVQTYLGTRENLHSTAAGKAMLSVMDNEHKDIVSQVQLSQHTEHTIVDPAELREELADIRSSGIAFDNEEQFDGVRCVATAITTDTDDLLGAISVNGPAERIDDAMFYKEIPQALQNVAGVIEINTAYLGWMEQTTENLT